MPKRPTGWRSRSEPALAGWNGIGFVVQAYQKRCPQVLDFLVDLARRSQRRLMVRLVKGAYWDSEIKRAQVDGLEGYPVYTRKVYTDVSYLACARRLLAVPESIYPQFATHNAHTVAAIHEAAGPDYRLGQYEFQCLHGMGEPLYEQVVAPAQAGGLGRPCRIYAPVGTHETLLAYLVRRLLENGANTSFVNRIADETLSIDELVADPVHTVATLAAAEGALGLPHPAIPLPRALYGPARANSSGLDLSNEHRLASLAGTLAQGRARVWRAAPLVNGEERIGAAPEPVRNPAEARDVVGHVSEATAEDIADALTASVAAACLWSAWSPADRAGALARAADLMEVRTQELVGLIVREAGKTCANAVSEVREAVDFLRYYAAQVTHEFANDSHRALGPVVCISPWNFPLAIFTGQVAAALAAGNAVLAKPAEQTPLVAAEAVRLLHDAGIPAGALQLLPGRGETVGAALVADDRVRGVMFTGSTEVARLLQQSLAGRLDAAGRPPVLIAETGGQNAMIVDSSALAEQVVTDVIASALDSAGQRCSALRVLCLQVDVADRVIEMLKGAMRELCVGRPDRLSVDVGPVIDAEAQAGIERHVSAMRAKGHDVFALPLDDSLCAQGHFVAPTLIMLDDIGALTREIFGPVLHVVRYQRQDMGKLVERINATGYGLTLGLHTRLDETIEFVTDRARAGNQYVNRNMVGAVVGVQPFGGEGLSGTGPKAGGPLYLRSLLSTCPLRPPGALVAALEDAEHGSERATHLKPLAALRQWLRDGADADLVAYCDALLETSPVGVRALLAGPTGESNTYRLQPRDGVLCVADSPRDLLFQLATVLAAGSRAVWLDGTVTRALRARLPATLQCPIDWAVDAASGTFAAALAQTDPASVVELSRQLARRAGPIIGLQACAPGDHRPGALSIERLLLERSLSVNTAAAGGNASLMTIG
jgi:RHH-type proline utilization regulon transcriptional repressor/proline dehydrogenase/delta 1-pyrroline-5-carboxylate dehydrogenase